jgi:hypothetical protein
MRWDRQERNPKAAVRTGAPNLGSPRHFVWLPGSFDVSIPQYDGIAAL